MRRHGVFHQRGDLPVGGEFELFKNIIKHVVLEGSGIAVEYSAKLSAKIPLRSVHSTLHDVINLSSHPLAVFIK